MRHRGEEFSKEIGRLSVERKSVVHKWDDKQSCKNRVRDRFLGGVKNRCNVKAERGRDRHRQRQTETDVDRER